MSATAAIAPDRILKDLRKLWVDLGKQEKSGVLRACSMTLISVVEERHDQLALGETIASLMHEHPSRAIVLKVSPGEAPLLEARVFAQCWMPFGRRQQICCEQVEITASPASLNSVPSVIRGLTVPDLPVMLFCPSVSVCQSAGFDLLLPLAGKLIVDSATATDSRAALRWLNRLPRQGPRQADLVWSRLTPWRASISHIFENPENRRVAYDLTDVDIVYEGTDPPVAVYYLAGWFMHVLGAGVHLNVAVGDGPFYSSIARVSLRGRSFHASIKMTDQTLVEIEVNGVQQRSIFPAMGDCDPLRQELSILGRDAVFEDVLGLANLISGNS